jgi:tetratricopeptide (TPR) repeat protein
MRTLPFRLPALVLLLAPAVAPAQDPALKDTFLQAKALWSTQGNREEALARFEKVVEGLAPKAATLSTEWVQVLSETYNWLAVLDDRNAQTRPRARTRFEALIALNPDFDVDRTLTSAKLSALFDGLKAEKLASLKLTYSPEGGLLQVDGKPSPLLPRKFLAYGTHRIAYSRAGHAPVETSVELGPREAKSLDLKLTRTSSTLTLHVNPSGAEVLLDGRSLGRTRGSAGPEAAALAAKANLRAEDLSEAFLVGDLKPGEHTLEVKSPCFKTRVLKVGKDLTDPMADHLLEAVKLEPSKGLLSIQSPWEGGELLLNGQSYGTLPVDKLPVCTGSYDLLVRFPSGGFSARVEIAEGKTLTLEARPRPRLAFLGLEGAQEFTGRPRLQGLLTGLGEKLQTVAFIPPRPGESTKDALTRLKAGREAELFLVATPVAEKVIHQVELLLSTLEGEEERILVKPLEADPLGGLIQRLNALPPLSEPSVGISLVDLPAEAPMVIAVDPLAQKAGVQVGRSLTTLNTKPLTSVAAFRQQLGEVKSKDAALAQGPATFTLGLTREPLEIPLSSPQYAYPFLLAHLRLQLLGARGEEAGLLKLNLALAYMHFRKYDKALELLRDTRLAATRGVSQGTLDFYTGVCFLKLGGVYVSEAAQAFRAALKAKEATLFGPEGPLVAPLAKAALDELKL